MSDNSAQVKEAQDVINSKLADFNKLAHAEETSLEVYHTEPSQDQGHLVVFVRNPAKKSFKVEVNLKDKAILGVQPLILLD